MKNKFFNPAPSPLTPLPRGEEELKLHALAISEFPPLPRERIEVRGFGLKFLLVSIFGVLGLPNISLAQGLGSSFRDIILSIVKVLSDDIIPIMTAIAFLIVLYNFTMFIFKSDNETERGYFKTYTIWSLIAFFVLLTVFAIVKVFYSSIFGGSAIGIPQFQAAR